MRSPDACSPSFFLETFGKEFRCLCMRDRSSLEMNHGADAVREAAAEPQARKPIVLLHEGFDGGFGVGANVRSRDAGFMP